MPRIHVFDVDGDDDAGLDALTPAPRPRVARGKTTRQADDAARFKPVQRRNESEPFKCGKCRAFIDPPLSGSKYRNHCPLCLTSKHVDRRRPGDRESPCRGLMPAVATYFKPDGEQMILHRCNGCDIERGNRIGADDNELALAVLPVVPPPRKPETDDLADDPTAVTVY